MDIKKFEINLKKINTLKQNIDLSGEEISKLEIQLLKNYIQKMYEAISMDYFEETEEDFEPVKKKKKKKKDKILVVDNAEEQVDEEVSEPEVVEEEPEEEIVQKKVYDESLLALFETNKNAELSDKLGSLPITDIKKAIGINDRIFTINELFGGDKELFNNTLNQLNELDGFESARDYLLENVAEKYDWSKADNINKAKRFIKLVRRRYSGN